MSKRVRPIQGWNLELLRLYMIKDQKEFGCSGLNIEQLIVLCRAYLLCI